MRWLAGIAVVILAACGGGSDETKPRTTKPEPVTITYDEYLKIPNGATVQEVEDIIGGPGRRHNVYELGGREYTTYSWKGREPKTAGVVSFTDAVVSGKIQEGLG